MTTVTVDIDKLNSAVEAMEGLAGRIDSQRSSATSATPIGLPSLSGLARKAQWLRDNVSELTSRRELARLLDTEGSGTASYEISSDTQANVDDLLSATLASELSDIDPDTSQEDVDRINGVMSDLAHNAPVMAMTYDRLGPEGTASALSNIVQAMPEGDYDSLYSLAETMRTGLATASNSDEWARRPDYPHGSTYAENFALQLVRSSVPIPGFETDGLVDDITTGSRSSGLAFLLQDSSLGRDFVKGAADGLDQFETTFEDEDSMWGSATEWYQQYSVSPLTPRDIGFDDPMEAIMDRMADKPDLGLEWFSSGMNGDRQTRYFNDRDWSNDGYGSISDAAASISTDPGNLEADPHNTTKLASTFIDQVANSPGFNAEDAKAASPHIADLLEFYMPAVDQALRRGEPEGVGNSVENFEIPHFGSFDYYPEFYTDDLDNIMQVAMGTPEGMTSIANGVGSFQQTQLNNAAAELGVNPDDYGLNTQLRGVLENTAALQGFTEYSVGQVEIEGARDQDAQRQAYIDLVGDAAGFVPIPGADQLGDLGGKLVDYGWNQGQELASGAASDHFASAEDGATSIAEERAEAGTNRVKINAYLSLVRAGIIPESEVDDRWYQENGDLISVNNVPGDEMGEFTQSAQNGVGEHATDMDLENSYQSSFLSYYQPIKED